MSNTWIEISSNAADEINRRDAEIERLRAEVDRLQNSLSEYKSILRFLAALDLEWFTEHDELLLETIVKNARSALGQQGEK